MAQAVFVVTNTVETGHTEITKAGGSSPTVAASKASAKPKVSPNQPGPIRGRERWSTDSKERWSTDSKERWSTSPAKKQSDGHANGHNSTITPAKPQVPVNQGTNKFPAKTTVNKNRRESPLTKSKEGPSSTLSAPTQATARPKRSGRSFIDRNPDFHLDISLRGEASETESLDGLVSVPPVAAMVKRSKKQMTPQPAKHDDTAEPVQHENTETVDNTAVSVPTLIESRPKRSTGRSLFERNPDFAMDIPFAKVVEQNWKDKNLDSSPGINTNKTQKISQKDNEHNHNLYKTN